ncbi:hypothetical protein EMIT0111MI5_20588 [Burkholderia sp. IT-111MI5]
MGLARRLEAIRQAHPFACHFSRHEPRRVAVAVVVPVLKAPAMVRTVSSRTASSRRTRRHRETFAFDRRGNRRTQSAS